MLVVPLLMYGVLAQFDQIAKEHGPNSGQTQPSMLLLLESISCMMHASRVAAEGGDPREAALENQSTAANQKKSLHVISRPFFTGLPFPV